MLPLTAEVLLPDGATSIAGPRRVELGQLAGGLDVRMRGGPPDGTPDRVLTTWLVRAPIGSDIIVEAKHPRGGTVRRTLALA